LNELCDELKKNLKLKSAEIEQTLISNQVLRDDMTVLQNKLQSNYQDIQNNLKALEEKNTSIRNLENDLQANINKVSEVKSEAQDLRLELDKIQSDYESKTAEIDSLHIKLKLNMDEKSELELKCNSYGQKLNEKRELLRTKTDDLEKLSNDIKNYVDIIEEQKKSIQQTKTELDDFNQTNAQREKKVQKLECLYTSFFKI
ncbi:MAG: hypothetical protein MHPSP_002813, partial [Paramarteilia canceri]